MKYLMLIAAVIQFAFLAASVVVFWIAVRDGFTGDLASDLFAGMILICWQFFAAATFLSNYALLQNIQCLRKAIEQKK